MTQASQLTVTPFEIPSAEQEVADLKARLALTRWADKEPVADWSQGIPLAYMKELKEYWQNEYDWQSRVAKLNQWDGFMTNVDGLDIHFLHVRSKHEQAKPLLLTHGWPGSIVEFQKVIGPLSDPTAHGGNAEDAFHVVCPTLPGFGYSGKPTATGWNISRIATAWDTLMVGIGYDKYFAQGGDWGSIVTATIGSQNKGHCMAVHMNMPIARPDPDKMDDLTELEQSALAGMKFYQDHDSGYSKIQATRPQTVGYGLVDSPMGQAGWIIEKFYQWTDCDGHPENILSRDELLDNVMMYWLPGAGASSARIYWESFNNNPIDNIVIPTGCSIFPKEIFKTSKRWAESRFTNLIHFNELDKGGHFAAAEQPAIFVDEIRTCFRQVR